MAGAVMVMMLLLLRVEAGYLSSQHRKQICNLKKFAAADAQPATARDGMVVPPFFPRK
jgi:hypothetical protein